MNFNNTLFRCSSLGHLMTDPKSKAAKDAGELSESTKTHLMDVYVSRLYDRKTDIQSKFIEKGLMVEEDSITLYSRVKKKMYLKNEEHLKNDYIMGTPDLYEGKDIHHASVIIDTKSSWDAFTFFRNLTKSLDKGYYWQLQGYMALTGAKTSRLAYCLVNTPLIMINDEKRRLMYKMGVISDMDELYLEACEELERQMTFDDIPMKDRLIEFTVERNDDDIERLYNTIERSRTYLNELYKRLHPDVIIAEYDPENKLTLCQ